jgi:tetratricopeptide (TPR) repeat protein
VSSKKDKLLESAQKFISKGQLDRAIKDYEQVVAIDPDDIRFRQRLAELLVRANRKEEAIREYEEIGRHYSNNTFFLKAIAVYKQIQKLDPANPRITITLASLNEKQGLVGNALAEYSAALNYYQKAKQLPEAISVLEQMLAADPENLNTHLKFAETYYAAGINEKAYERFCRLAHLLGRSGDESAFRQICSRICSIFPERRDFLTDLATNLIGEGHCGMVIPQLRSLAENDSENRKAWDLLAEAYRCTGEQDKLKAVLREMAGLFPDSAPSMEVSTDTVAEETNLELPDVEEMDEPAGAAGMEVTEPESQSGESGYGGSFEGLESHSQADEELENYATFSETLDNLLLEETGLAELPSGDEFVAGPEKVGTEPAESLPGKDYEELEAPLEKDWEEEIDIDLLEEGAGEFPLDLAAEMPPQPSDEDAQIHLPEPPSMDELERILAETELVEAQSPGEGTEFRLDLAEEAGALSLDNLLD